MSTGLCKGSEIESKRSLSPRELVADIDKENKFEGISFVAHIGADDSPCA